MKDRVLNISIPVPCGQVFEEMPVSGDGRLCGECKNIIYDFSQMTDAQLLRFFEKKPGTSCGRFHNSQLGRNIELQKTGNNLYSRIIKVAASLLALITFRSASAGMQRKPGFNIVQQELAVSNRLKIWSDSLIIKGTVRDKDGMAIENAKIQLDNIKTAFTDQNGNYTIALPHTTETHNLYFSFNNLIPEVRSYHPAMGNAIFDVTLSEHDSVNRYQINHIIGIISSPADTFLLMFKQKSVLLSNDQKSIIKVIADKMKANPLISIEINAYPVEHSTEYYLANKREAAIENYLINEQGISLERISTQVISVDPYMHNPKVIEIRFVL